MEPITVTIKDLLGQSRNIAWLAKGQRWIDAHKTITIDYDPWSCGNREQRMGIIAALSGKSVEFTMRVLTRSGEYAEILYDPSQSTGVNKPMVSPTLTIKTPPPEVLKQLDVQLDDKPHIIVAAGEGKDAADYLGFKATEVKPPNRDNDADPRTGFKVGSIEASGKGNVITTSVLPTSSVEEAGLVEKQEDEAESTPIDVEAAKVMFQSFIDAKDWNGALQLLTDTFGADKVTFTARTVMSMKDWDAIVKKYSLI